MSWWQRMIERVAGPIIEARVKEQMLNLPIARKGDENFRRMTANPQRDLTPLAQDRQAEIAYYLWKTNGLATRMLELPRDMIVGGGFKFTAENDDVAEILERFWNDGVNQMDLTLDQRVLELGMYGEQCWPVFVSPHMGRVRLGYLDPTAIEGVQADPENAAILLGVQTKQEVTGKPRRYAIILNEDEETILSTAGRQLRSLYNDGACFFFSVNRALNATRGSSDLLPLLDWLDAYENWLFDRLEWASQLGAFLWDVTLKGMNQEQIQQWLENNPSPKRGSVRAHNEAVEWQAVSPDLKSADLQAIQKVFLHHILSVRGWPEHWFTAGGDVNRAVGAEMSEPILKTLSKRQGYVKHMLAFKGRYVVRQAINAGLLREKVPVKAKGSEGTVLKPAVETFKVEAPEISAKDINRISQAMAGVSAALLIGQSNRWISGEDAAGVFAMLASMLGREVEPAPQDAGGGPGGEDFTPERLAEMRRRLGMENGNQPGHDPDKAVDNKQPKGERPVFMWHASMAVVNVNEIRESVGLPPVEGGDLPVVTYLEQRGLPIPPILLGLGGDGQAAEVAAEAQERARRCILS
jgi:hypothetical protein